MPIEAPQDEAIPLVAIKQLFTEARTQNGYLATPVDDSTLRKLYELVKWGPTSTNCCPARLLFLRSMAAREQLADCVSERNAQKVLQAPVTVVLGMDLDFPDYLPRLFPHMDARPMFAGNPALVAETALRNSSLQGGYLIMAARALGLGCGPMSGFDAAKVDAAFWGGTRVRTNFLCTLGIGDASKLFGRLPRLELDDACRFL